MICNLIQSRCGNDFSCTASKENYFQVSIFSKYDVGLLFHRSNSQYNECVGRTIRRQKKLETFLEQLEILFKNQA